MKQHRSSILLVLCLAIAAVVFAFKSDLLSQSVGEALAAPAGIELRAEPVPLSEADPALTRVGALKYLAGWALTSPHDRFGGLSGLTISEDGTLVAISDQGDWFTGHFNPVAPQPITDAELVPFDLNMPEDSKKGFDAESLIRLDDGFLVAFEHRHRLEMAKPGGVPTPWAPAQGMEFGGISDNGGMEAISWTADGQLLAFAERGVDVQGLSRAWLVGADGIHGLFFKRPKNFAPTDAALLPNGDILLLTRFFSVVDGVAIKLLRFKAEDIRPGATLVGEELAHLAPPLTVDNLEGLEVGTGADGTTLVYMLSDDNFSSNQRTLLLMFALEG
ncbi:esterase-like activity of phytase family protein [Kordiimonas lacus]|uniref:Phytase-like domain-containing protein n=1 Tax=Kordiimonas lacus TaxID=637679 RepID=A0A1G6TYW9_9PROT|nr:esterase-like activity of phytase family protein [Kordiimonas lacus]SDD33636.1 hypothetical protein SAMN04488071_0392 [Kordiimonas lacus]